MKVINIRNTKVSTYNFEARDWKVSVEFLNGKVSFRASYDGDLIGIVFMSYEEALVLASSIDLFFTEGKRGKEFNNSVKPVLPQGIPMLRIQYTNWASLLMKGYSSNLAKILKITILKTYLLSSLTMMHGH